MATHFIRSKPPITAGAISVASCYDAASTTAISLPALATVTATASAALTLARVPIPIPVCFACDTGVWVGLGSLSCCNANAPLPPRRVRGTAEQTGIVAPQYFFFLGAQEVPPNKQESSCRVASSSHPGQHGKYLKKQRLRGHVSPPP